MASFSFKNNRGENPSPKDGSGNKEGRPLALSKLKLKLKQKQKHHRLREECKKMCSHQKIKKKSYLQATHFPLTQVTEALTAAKYSLKGFPRRNKFDHNVIIKFSLTTESVKNSTLVFTVDFWANRQHMKRTVEKLYNINVANINTCTRLDGQEKTYVYLTYDYDGLDAFQ